MRFLLGASLLASMALACGSSPVEPAAPVVPPEAASGAEVTETLPPAPPSEWVVLLDGVRDGVVQDVLDGWQLVSGAGTVALVGPDGHVRASHRFSYGGGGATAAFVPTEHAVVGNGDYEGFRGPHSGGLDRWHLDTDTLERLTAISYEPPSMGRLGPITLVGLAGPSEIHIIGAESDELVSDLPGVWCPAVEPPHCLLGIFEDVEAIARLDERGELSITELDEPTNEGDAEPRTAPPPAPVASTLPNLGARGIPSGAFAPRSSRVVFQSSAGATILDAGGIGETYPGSDADVHWFPSETGLSMGTFLSPFTVPTSEARSELAPELYGGDYDDDAYIPEQELILEWGNRLGEDPNAAPPVLAPVCTAEGTRPARCVRAELAEGALVGWQIYDPARPSRVLATIDDAALPPTPTTVALGAGGRRIRRVEADGTLTLLPIGRGPAYRAIDPSCFVELGVGWAFSDPDDVQHLISLEPSGRTHERRYPDGVEVMRIQMVDAARILVSTRDSLEVLSMPALDLLETIPMSNNEDSHQWACRGPDLVDAEAENRGEDGLRIAGGCPAPGTGEYEDDSYLNLTVQVSSDRALWFELLGDEARLHRTVDDATLLVRLTTDGVLVTGPGGVFEARGAVADHLVVREPGPVRTAAITFGAEARARFERPGLVAAFFRGEPLPVATE